MRFILCFSLSLLCVSCKYPSTDPAPETTEPEVQLPVESKPEVADIAEEPDTEFPEEIPGQITVADVGAVEQCDIGPSIEWMASQTIIYTQDPSDEWRDCSGNFLRLSSHISEICDVDLVAPPGVSKYVDVGSYQTPGNEEARTTRGIAEWYDQKNAFVPIFYDGVDITEAPEALKAIREKIKPGAVLWFSQRKPLATDGKEGLYREVGGAIGHMGTVTSVERDANGRVTGWDMYHGQNSRKHNGITSHWWDWPEMYTSRGQEYPPGGYWNQRIVGFAESLVPDAGVEVVALRN